MASLPAHVTPAPSLPLAGLRIEILGRGRVGRAMAVALAARGATVQSGPGSTTPDVTTADLVLLAVPDDAVAEVAQRVEPQLRAGQVLGHTSGRHGLGVLGPARPAGPDRLALHPAMTFGGSEADAQSLDGARMGITADPGALALAERLCQALGAVPTRIAEEDRALYHAGLAHAANHLVTLIAEAQTLLTRAGVDDPSAVLRPLVTAALEGALELGAFATTGPVARGDSGTVATHVEAIATAAPTVLPSYEALAQSTARQAEADGRLSGAQARMVTDVLVGVRA